MLSKGESSGMSSLLFLARFFFFQTYSYITKVVSNGYLIFLKQMKDEEPINYIIVSLCRGLADYDANEIVPAAGATSTRDENSEGYSD